MILIKDMEGETLVKIAAVHFGNAIAEWMNDIGVLKVIYPIHYVLSAYSTNTMMNLFAGLSCFFFHNFQEAISECTKFSMSRYRKYWKNLSGLYACFDVGRCSGKRIWASFLLADC
ncbi:hypothetical protein CDAR_456691 [Caerostris darwini]|uniref:Uncharacterized protein n=1 Tax=Caerostris darwini TaxID=1538125 RepID=A0AAV4WAE7_9ARAC|nr:hypothetical protein CDAR_456691 [Caerostris darwini]